MFTPGGGSDGEQTWPHGVAMGLDKPDLLEVRAPRPTQVQKALTALTEAAACYAAEPTVCLLALFPSPYRFDL